MVVTLFFDTETTGLAKFKSLSALQMKGNWPDLVSICWIMYEGTERIKKVYHIIRPDEWTIPAASSQIHGITEEIATEQGNSLRVVLESFKEDCKAANYIVAHNMFFDKNVLFNAYAWRLGTGPTGFWNAQKEICTMQKSKNELKIPSKYGKPNDMYKYPSLDDLYRATFSEEPPGNAHSADRDVEVLSQTFWRRWGETVTPALV